LGEDLTNGFIAIISNIEFSVMHVMGQHQHKGNRCLDCEGRYRPEPCYYPVKMEVLLVPLLLKTKWFPNNIIDNFGYCYFFYCSWYL